MPPFLTDFETLGSLDTCRKCNVFHKNLKEKPMKTLRIIQCIGYFALFLASVFNFINQITEKNFFGLAITLPLFVIAIVGIICDIILITKKRKKRFRK